MKMNVCYWERSGWVRMAMCYIQYVLLSVGFCDFEMDMCGWVNSPPTEYGVDWDWLSGNSDASSKPAFDHSTGSSLGEAPHTLHTTYLNSQQCYQTLHSSKSILVNPLSKMLSSNFMWLNVALNCWNCWKIIHVIFSVFRPLCAFQALCESRNCPTGEWVDGSCGPSLPGALALHRGLDIW